MPVEARSKPGRLMRDIMQMKLFVALAATMLAFGSEADAQKFPDRPMTMIIPFAAGGPTDILGRVVRDE
jgi:tripartite-type tricarboxylate transporter receptor subunit TctC